MSAKNSCVLIKYYLDNGKDNECNRMIIYKHMQKHFKIHIEGVLFF